MSRNASFRPCEIGNSRFKVFFFCQSSRWPFAPSSSMIALPTSSSSWCRPPLCDSTLRPIRSSAGRGRSPIPRPTCLCQSSSALRPPLTPSFRRPAPLGRDCVGWPSAVPAVPLHGQPSGECLRSRHLFAWFAAQPVWPGVSIDFGRPAMQRFPEGSPQSGCPRMSLCMENGQTPGMQSARASENYLRQIGITRR